MQNIEKNKFLTYVEIGEIVEGKEGGQAEQKLMQKY